MKKFIYTLLIFTGCLIGCGKKDANISPGRTTSTTVTNTPEVTTGGLKGVISPIGAVVDISAAIQVNGNFMVTTIKPGPDGSFYFKDLPKGSGGLIFSPAVGYIAPAGISITITGGKDTDVGMVSIPVTPGSVSGTVSPVGSVSYVKLRFSNVSPDVITITPDPKSGSFKSANVPAGTYTLECMASPGFTAPASRMVTITSAQNTDVGNIQISPSVPGSISGTVSPAGAVASVTAYFLGGPAKTYSTVPDASGDFKLTSVIAGNYRVVFNLVSGSNLYGPADRSVDVLEDKDTNIGTIIASSMPPPSNFTAVLSGAAFKTNASSATYDAGQQSLNIGSYINGGSFTLKISGINAPGEYACNNSTGSEISFVKAVKTHPGLSDSQYTIQSWSTRSANGTGVIKITSFDRVNKTVSGTFSGTLLGSGGTTNVSDGVLTNIPYQ
jgi:hypothetical protein